MAKGASTEASGERKPPVTPRLKEERQVTGGLRPPLAVPRLLERERRLGPQVGDAQAAAPVEHREQLRQDVLGPPPLGQQRLRRQRPTLEPGPHQELEVLAGGDEIRR